MKIRKNIGVIPARGGSKRLPGKNIANFFGKPLIAWTIEAAIESKIFDRIIVSTDCNEIAAVSRDFGAEVPFMRDAYADDISSGQQAVIYALGQAERHFNEEYEQVTLLQACCPLRKAQDIIDSYKNFVDGNRVFQISCFDFGWHHPWWACKLDRNLSPTFLFPQALKSRSQDLEKLYCPSGAVWIANVAALKKSQTFYADPLTFFPLDWKASADIDTKEDLEFAKAIFLLNGSVDEQQKVQQSVYELSS